MKKFLVLAVGLAITTSCFSQTGYTLESGQSMSIDDKGKIASSPADLNKQSKQCETTEVPNVVNEKNSAYYSDGKLKIPGYTPTGNAEADEELYNKAKLMLYYDHPEEYNKIFGQKVVNRVPSVIPYEEFQTYPDVKKQIILSHPEKYTVGLPVDAHDCK